MKTVLTVTIDTDESIVSVQETNEESVIYNCSTDSLDSIAYYTGEAVSDYICGLG